MMFPHRLVMDRLIENLCLIAAIVSAGLLFLIIGYLFIGALPVLSLNFVFLPESAVRGVFDGAIGNAIAGTILISVCATLVAAPFALGTAVYLAKYAPQNKFTDTLRFFIEVLSGTPSIVIGVFGFLILVVYLKPFSGGYSLIAGAIGLAILIVPVIERGAEEAIAAIPSDLEEGSYALGATKWQTVRLVTIPAALSGIITGIILGFGRAAEESAIVILTAGYTQFMPEFAIKANQNMFLGIQVFPLQDLVATLPLSVYNAYEHANIVPMANGFAAAFVLVCIVLVINVIARAVAGRFAWNGPKEDSLPAEILKKLPFSRKKAATPAGSAAETGSGEQPDTRIPEATTVNRELHPADAGTGSEPVPSFSFHREIPSEEKTAQSDVTPTRAEPSRQEPQTSSSPSKQYHITLGKNLRTWLQSLRPKPSAPSPQPESPVPPKETPKRRVNLRDFIRPFLFTLIPFLLVAALLLVLSGVFPALSPAGTGGVLDFFKSIVIALVIGAICAIIALFLLRRSARILGLKKKNPLLGNRTGAMVAVVTGICLVLVGAFILSAHLFVPPITTASAAQEAAATSSAGVINTPVFSFNLQPQDLITLQKMNNPVFSFALQNGDLQVRVVNQTITEMNVSMSAMAGGTESLPAAGTGTAADKSARLAAFLAQQDTGEENTVSTATTVTSSPATTLTPAPVAAAPASAPAVPDKYALDLGESYWYGDNYRPCLATVYDTTVLPFYFWWDMGWNRFVQQSPAQSGDMFLVIFIRIEDTGNMSAMVPSADSFVVVNNGRTYTHESYFDTSVLSQNEINYYSANFNKLPYQWIREIGNQKRDYAFLTGYNVFGENQTLITNYTGLNSALVPPSPPDTNGQGYFIKPGRSNAIDGYLIYEVPAAVAADLKDTYVQVSFNSFSPAQWRLGKYQV